MDKGTLGAISTVLVAIAFTGVCWWAFAPKRRQRFNEDAKLPFADENNNDEDKDESNSSTDDVARRD